MNTELPAQWAAAYDEMARELEVAAGHCKTAAGHFRNEDVPRGAAHAWAAFGHLEEARQALVRQARNHAAHSRPAAAPSPPENA